METLIPNPIEVENARLRLVLDEAGIEASKLQTSDRMQRLLLEELHHRVKNTLATVMAIVSQSLKHVGTPQEAEKAILARLMALGTAHDILLQVDWTGARIFDVVVRAIEPFGAARFDLRLPDLRIAGPAVLPLALVLNELGTNATKYGSLSVNAGRVSIEGVQRDGNALRFTWRESGGPVVIAPREKHFGTRLIESSFRDQLGAPQVDYLPDGVVCEFTVPLAGAPDRERWTSGK